MLDFLLTLLSMYVTFNVVILAWVDHKITYEMVLSVLKTKPHNEHLWVTTNYSYYLMRVNK